MLLVWLKLHVNCGTEFLVQIIIEPHHEKTFFSCVKTKVQISCTVTRQLISAFVFTTLIVQLLYFLVPKFPIYVAVQPSLCRTWSDLKDKFSIDTAHFTPSQPSKSLSEKNP